MYLKVGNHSVVIVTSDFEIKMLGIFFDNLRKVAFLIKQDAVTQRLDFKQT